MEKNRKTTALVIAALVVSVISLGVAFAAFSTQLNISGTAKIAGTTWDIHFSDASDGSTTGGTVTPSLLPNPGSTATSTTPTLTGTDFTWSATFKSVGDKVQYHFYVTNQGDYNAKLSGINTPTISCTGDTAGYCNHIKYTVSYDAAGSQTVSNNDSLTSGQTKDIYVTAYLDDYTTGDNKISTPPSAELTTNTITTTLVYTQDGPAVTSSSNSGNN